MTTAMGARKRSESAQLSVKARTPGETGRRVIG